MTRRVTSTKDQERHASNKYTRDDPRSDWPRQREEVEPLSECPHNKRRGDTECRSPQVVPHFVMLARTQLRGDPGVSPSDTEGPSAYQSDPLLRPVTEDCFRHRSGGIPALEKSPP